MKKWKVKYYLSELVTWLTVGVIMFTIPTILLVLNIKWIIE